VPCKDSRVIWCFPLSLQNCTAVIRIGEGVEAAADKAGSKASDAVDAVKGLATEAADTARAAGESPARGLF